MMYWIAYRSQPESKAGWVHWHRAGLLGMAFRLEFRFLLFFGALSMLCSVVLTGVGLMRGLRKVAAF